MKKLRRIRSIRRFVTFPPQTVLIKVKAFQYGEKREESIGR